MTGWRANDHTISVRKHPIVLTRPFLAILIGLVIIALISEASPAYTSVLMIWIWAAWGVLVLRLAWKTAQWSKESLVVTPEQVFLSSGLLSRRISYTPMAAVANMSLQESFFGRVLGYGELRLELEGQGQPLTVIDHVPYSDKLYLELCTWIFFSNEG
jgi:uncharacterized membrane protein YdbT with pleckstrin-like domain